MNLRSFIPTLALSSLAISNAALALDQNLPPYQTVDGLSGYLKSVGSDTLHDEMVRWSNAFTALYPNVKIEVKGEGSVTATPALIDGTAKFGPMSRPMSNDEVHAFVDTVTKLPTFALRWMRWRSTSTKITPSAALPCTKSTACFR